MWSRQGSSFVVDRENACQVMDRDLLGEWSCCQALHRHQVQSNQAEGSGRVLAYRRLWTAGGVLGVSQAAASTAGAVGCN